MARASHFREAEIFAVVAFDLKCLMCTNARRIVLRAWSLYFGATRTLSEGLPLLLPVFRRIERRTTVAWRSDAGAMEFGTEGGSGSFLISAPTAMWSNRIGVLP